MQYWACNSHILLSDANCETCEQFVLQLVFIACQEHGNKSLKVHFKLQQQVFFSMWVLNASILAGKTKFVGHDGGMQANASQLELFSEPIWHRLRNPACYMKCMDFL